jgi:hypothetical protein
MEIVLASRFAKVSVAVEGQVPTCPFFFSWQEKEKIFHVGTTTCQNSADTDMFSFLLETAVERKTKFTP